MKMKSLTTLALAGLLTVLLAPSAWAQDKPNIVLINMDNFGYGELGVYGGGITRGAPTPRIDKLASEGATFTRMFAENICTPTRAAFVTGRLAVRTGMEVTKVTPPEGMGLNGKEVTIEGFFFLGFEIMVLSEELINSGYAEGHLIPGERMLWIEGGIPTSIHDELYEQQMMGPSERYGKVLVRGVFQHGGEYGHLGAYQYQISPSEIQLLSWSPPQ